MKKFNTTGPCLPEKHYMADLKERLEYIRVLIGEGAYFTINRARQYGKTTILAALARAIAEDYLVISLDFQKFSQLCFEDEKRFSQAFTAEFYDEAKRVLRKDMGEHTALNVLRQLNKNVNPDLRELFRSLVMFCEKSSKPVVLIIDEADSATNNQVFLDFLAQLRNSYLDRALKDKVTFQSVILAGLYDVRNIRQKIRGSTEHRVNSPWNIAADFDMDMSFSRDEIARMLYEYETDHHTGMDVMKIAGLIYDYTSGYPFLVSRLCKLTDEKARRTEQFKIREQMPDNAERTALQEQPWTTDSFHETVHRILAEKNPLFDSMTGKLREYPQLNEMLRLLLFTGKSIVYNPDDEAMDIAVMFGFVKVCNGNIVVANRIFETRLYNMFLAASEMQNTGIYRAALQDKNQFVQNGRLNMERVLERFAEHFNDLYGNRNETFYEEDGRRYFLLYLQPVINGTGNYYVESRTRNMERTDVIVDYYGEQFVIEMKIRRGSAYHERGEKQLAEYLEHYHLKKGYMLSFNFNKNKRTGIRQIRFGDKILVEAVV